MKTKITSISEPAAKQTRSTQKMDRPIEQFSHDLGLPSKKKLPQRGQLRLIMVQLQYESRGVFMCHLRMLVHGRGLF
ncbi:MAG: hypothetical protein IPJ71_11465 [Bdellovibrionales bacterium]|nr:hypothetical protein [Bdellovibrionales bacterium]